MKGLEHLKTIEDYIAAIERLEYAKQNWDFDLTEQGLYEYVMFGEIKVNKE